MSDSVRPSRRQPTRLPRPRDSAGKNTGAGCPLLLRCRKVKSEREVAQSCPTLSGPMDCSPPGSSIHGIFQARGLERGDIAFSAGYYKFPQIISPQLLVFVRWLNLNYQTAITLHAFCVSTCFVFNANKKSNRKMHVCNFNSNKDANPRKHDTWFYVL